MDRGHRVALVTDGRMSRRVGQGPGGDPLHARGGRRRPAVPRARRRRRPRRRRDRPAGRSTSTSASASRGSPSYATHGTGRELFAAFRDRVGRPDDGASGRSAVRPSGDGHTHDAHHRRTRRPGAGHPGRRDRRPRGRRPARRGARARRPAGDRGDAAHRRRRLRRSSGSPPRCRAPSSARARSPRPRRSPTALEAGARFLVSPGATPTLLDALQASGVPFLPGTATASDIVALLERGITHAKLLPGRGRRRDQAQGAREGG